MVTLSILTWQEQAFEISHALAEELPTLERPTPTTVLVARIARRMGTDERDRVAKHILKLAPKHVHATHNGEVKMRFGRSMTGYMWHATPQRSQEPVDHTWSIPPNELRAKAEAEVSRLGLKEE